MNSDIDPLYDKTTKCLLCDHKFHTKKVRSRFSLARSMETDFFTEYIHDTNGKNINPLLYYVNVCPSCGYSYSDEANTYFLSGTKEAIMEKITTHWKGQDYFCDVRNKKVAIDSYKLAILAGSIKKERPIVMAGLHMRLSWIYRTLEMTEEETRFKGYALEQYEKSYFQGDFQNSSMSAIRLSYLIGELHRQFGNFQKASQFFSKIIHIKQPMKDRLFIELARDQWYDMAKVNRAKKV
ncbi:DUF2225 domain-containing protein [Anaerobacillus alkaliphilus]|uniref:DUF2225 domain-containing protein n=1 Tax=Anaerobacillus alkaliphilus TaxID=1548597 RepID=A0A4Q0VRX8_9BACI|nr:DUF2225 domain-containing protein [Anaerobacillus alkaliphilus]RXJ00350.1 DUF2225 domain-containing protein [Anaerobacillus alkaliphilus]